MYPCTPRSISFPYPTVDIHDHYRDVTLLAVLDRRTHCCLEITVTTLRRGTHCPPTRHPSSPFPCSKPPHQIVKIITEIDPQRQARIPFEKFAPYLERKIDAPSDAENLITGLRAFDKDNNGFMNLAELRHVLTNLGEKLTQREVRLRVRVRVRRCASARGVCAYVCVRAHVALLFSTFFYPLFLTSCGRLGVCECVRAGLRACRPSRQYLLFFLSFLPFRVRSREVGGAESWQLSLLPFPRQSVLVSTCARGTRQPSRLARAYTNVFAPSSGFLRSTSLLWASRLTRTATSTTRRYTVVRVQAFGLFHSVSAFPVDSSSCFQL